MPAITKVPSSTQVYSIIVIGIASMLVALFLLFNSAHQLVSPFNKATDSIAVNYKKNMATDSGILKVAQIENRKNYSKEKLVFNNNPDFFVWICFVAIMVAFATCMWPVLLFSVRDVKQNFRSGYIIDWKLLLITAGIFCLIAFLSSYSRFLVTPLEVLDHFKILLSSTNTVRGIVLYILAIAMIAVYGQLLINKSVNNLPYSVNKLSSDEITEYSLKFNLLRQKLKFFLICSASLIVCAIIATELLRKAILTEVKTNIDIVPSNFVYIYGLIFTFFLAILYLPVYYRLRLKGEAMINIEEDEAPEKEKDPVLKRFIIKESPMESFKITFSILAPILTTLIPNIKLF